MMHLPRLFTYRVKLAAAVFAAAILAGCTSPPPPKPAMVPLGQTGDFGYSERDLGGDRVEIVYQGSTVKVPASATRNDARVQAELAKTRDLALWRAAQVAKDRGMAAFKIEKEARDTDIEVSQYLAPMSSPLGYRPYWGYPYGYGHYPRSFYYDDPFYYRPVRKGAGRVITTLTVQLFKMHNAADSTQLSTADTLAKLQTERSGAVY